MSFFFVSAVIWEKKISRKTFYVALTYENVPPGQIFWFLGDFSEKDRLGKLGQSAHRWSCVVVISDSNMSLSASSEDSVTVNVNRRITTNETMWMKEGDTTEDESSIIINEE